MKIAAFIDDTIPVINAEDSYGDTVKSLKGYNLMHLPIVDKNKHFLGYLKDHKPIANSFTKFIFELPISASRAFVYAHQHYYQGIAIANKFKRKQIAVLHEKNRYLGAVKWQKLNEKLFYATLQSEEGAILIFKIAKNEKIISKIFEIFELHDVEIISAVVSPHPTHRRFENLTLKLNTSNVQSPLNHLNHRGISVEAKYNVRDFSLETKNRIDSFLKYLEI